MRQTGGQAVRQFEENLVHRRKASRRRMKKSYTKVTGKQNVAKLLKEQRKTKYRKQGKVNLEISLNV